MPPATAMILAAGRGERMRPLSDAVPKPLLQVGGKTLIAWQIERLVAAGFNEIVINVAHLGGAIEASIGDGRAFGASVRYSREAEPLEVAGGIATALPLLDREIALIVSGDLYTTFDYRSLKPRLAAMKATREAPHAHMVIVPNPDYHREGDFALVDGLLSLAAGPRLTFGNIALYRRSLFEGLPRGAKSRILPLYRDWIGRGWVSGERFDGGWANVGTPEELSALEARLAAVGEPQRLGR
ncbi:MAG TPA: nucleotidyltransferase family protein [Casimicrobiaceae bacterium]|nr:nucleotidyltransferase family protein [Casimicrobiaceae bacterium]